MTRRYTVDAQWGGGEVTFANPCECLFTVPDGWVLVERVDGSQAMLPRGALTEVVPPMPPEPEPGAYRRGGLTLVGIPVDPGPGPDEPRCSWYVFTNRRSLMNHLAWWQAVDETGGPDADLVPLVPDPAHGVTVPWRINGIDGRMSGFTQVRLVAGKVQDGLGNQSESQGVQLSPDEAEQKAGALIAGARAARAEEANRDQ